MNAPHNNRSIHFTACLTRVGNELFRRVANPTGAPLALRVAMGAVATASLVMFFGALVGMGGCESDDVGHSKSVEKRTVDTPTEKVTTTETHEKETHYVK